MYAPKQYREDRQDVLFAAIRAIQFGTLVVSGVRGLDSVHLPMVLREGAGGHSLEGHVAIGNPVWKAAADEGVSCLAMFLGPHAYVHPGWYETKRITGKAVPTWNYVVVQARGTLSIRREADWLRDHVHALTQANEAQRPEPWAVADAPGAYVDAMLGAIVGLHLQIEAVEGVWKMNQHHSEANRLGVIAGLSAEEDAGARAVAEVMAAREG